MSNMIIAVRVIFSLVAVIALFLKYQFFWVDGLDAYLKTAYIVFQTLQRLLSGSTMVLERKDGFQNSGFG